LNKSYNFKKMNRHEDEEQLSETEKLRRARISDALKGRRGRKVANTSLIQKVAKERAARPEERAKMLAALERARAAHPPVPQASLDRAAEKLRTRVATNPNVRQGLSTAGELSGLARVLKPGRPIFERESETPGTVRGQVKRQEKVGQRPTPRVQIKLADGTEREVPLNEFDAIYEVGQPGKPYPRRSTKKR
jgi:hypothetical protein